MVADNRKTNDRLKLVVWMFWQSQMHAFSPLWCFNVQLCCGVIVFDCAILRLWGFVMCYFVARCFVIMLFWQRAILARSILFRAGLSSCCLHAVQFWRAQVWLCCFVACCFVTVPCGFMRRGILEFKIGVAHSATRRGGNHLRLHAFLLSFTNSGLQTKKENSRVRGLIYDPFLLHNIIEYATVCIVLSNLGSDWVKLINCK